MFKLFKTFLFLFFFSLPFCTTVSAQNNFPIEEPANEPKGDIFLLQKGIYINPIVSGGVGIPYGGSGFKSGLVVNGGGDFCYMFSSHFGVSAGAQYEYYSFGYKYSNNNSTKDIPAPSGSAADTAVFGGGNTTARYNFQYIRIPVLFRYISSSSGKLGFYVEGGATADILVHAGVSGSISETVYVFQRAGGSPSFGYSYSSKKDADITGVTPDAAKFNIAVHLGIGAMIPAGEHLAIVIAYCPEIKLMNGGVGDNDVVSFNSSKYYFYGQKSNYGSFISNSIVIKWLFKL